MNYFYAVTLIFLLASCDYEVEFAGKQEDAYIIEAGNHSSTYLFKGFEGNTLTFEAKFDESVEYKTKATSNQADVNKLLGFSDCGFDHHKNSARIGWRWYNNQLEILAYIYNNNKRIIEYITTVPKDEYVNYSISKGSSGYNFTVGDVQLHVPADFSECNDSGNYYLWPYFGGNEVAPHDIRINIQQIKEDGSESSPNGKIIFN